MKEAESWKLASGYRLAGVHCGIRPDPERLDLALIVSDRPAAAAGAFTQNRVVAAPVKVCRERLPRSDARGVVICSGNANACTGAQGLTDARRMAQLAAECQGFQPDQFLVCSTGVIGRPLPMAAIEPGIRLASSRIQANLEGLRNVAHAILTTDTRVKVATTSLACQGRTVTLTGFAKGAAMIGPNMATMLAFLLCDAPIAPADLAVSVRRSVTSTFNCISVEGHTSTNDTVLFFANGAGEPLAGEDLSRFQNAATGICGELARAIASDAEGASHLATIHVEGMRDDEEARRVAKAVAESALVKTALFGADPNWGRIVSAAGYAGVQFEEEQLSLWLGDMPLYHAGQPVPFDEAAASAYMKRNRDIDIRLRFSLGSGRCTFWTCDLTHDYIRLNAEYTT